MSDRTDAVGQPRPVDHEREEPTGRRALDICSLVAGVVVLVLCAAFALGDLDALDVQGRVVGPTVLLGVGVAILLSGRRSG